MNLSKEATMKVLEKLIEDLDVYYIHDENCEECLKVEVEIKAFQFHLKKFN